jgi:hypothetical protein
MRLKVTVNSQMGGIFSREFDSQEQVDAYVTEITSSEIWGRNERTEIQEDLETGEITEVTIPAQWNFSVEDITAQHQIETKVKNALKAQEVGAKIIARVWAINESKQLNAQSFNALMNDASLSRIERLLWTGSLKTAKILITSLDDTYFSADEKAEILAMIDNSGLA